MCIYIPYMWDKVQCIITCIVYVCVGLEVVQFVVLSTVVVVFWKNL